MARCEQKLCRNGEEAPVQTLAAPVLDGYAEDIDHAGCVAMQVEEDRASSQVVFNSGCQILPDRLKERMAGHGNGRKELPCGRHWLRGRDLKPLDRVSLTC